MGEASRLARAGVREINLIGQDTTGWGTDLPGRPDLADLLQALDAVDGLTWIRVQYTYPRLWSDRLIETWAHARRVVPYVDMPLQHIAADMLRTMARGMTARDTRALVRRIRDGIPGVSFRTNFIVGFPGETEQDFEATLRLVDEVRYASAYSFKYSARPGTPAATMEDQISREMMDERLQRLHERINTHQLAFNRSKVGTETRILIERRGKRDGQMIGRTPWLQSVHVDTDAVPGDILDVALISAGPNSLAGAVRQMAAA